MEMGRWGGVILGLVASALLFLLCVGFAGAGHGPLIVARACGLAALVALPAGVYGCSRSPAGKLAFLALMACQYLAVGAMFSGLSRDDFNRLTRHGAVPASGVLAGLAADAGWLYLPAQAALWGPFLWSNRVGWKRLELRWALLSLAFLALFLAQFAVLASRMRSFPVVTLGPSSES
jgi:hypothetical protein